MVRILLFFLIAASVYFCSTNTACADNAEEIAKKSQLAYKAFECSVLFNLKKDQSNQNKSFLVGYKLGSGFIEAMKNDEISSENISKLVPMVWYLVGGGPSNDFILGRVYSSVEEHVFDELSQDAKREMGEKSNYLSVATDDIFVEKLLRLKECRLMVEKNK